MKKIISIVVLIIIVVSGLFYFKIIPDFLSKNDSAKIEVPKNNGEEIVSVGNIVGSMKSASVGEYLTDSKGMTLYAYGYDKKLTSVCEKQCLQKWTVYYFDGKNVASSTDLLSRRMNLFKRKDGYYQYAYQERPVYYYDGDVRPGDTNGMKGENIGSPWSLILIQR